MAKEKISTTEKDIRASVSSIYAEVLNKRKAEKEAKEEARLKEKEEKELKKEEEKAEKENEPKLSKKEKREKELSSWESVIVGLTGDDLDYSDEKKTKKKKYRKWIDDDEDLNAILTSKPKKVKKKNYNKEFEGELNMLKSLVADQNKFTTDLQKRFTNAVGPATKDAMPLNKTMVDLAAAINVSRSNSLGVLREIGNIKKTIADLYMKQKKLDSDLGGSSGMDTTDLGLLGSGIASSLFADTPVQSSTPQQSFNSGAGYEEVKMPNAPMMNQSQLNSSQTSMVQQSMPTVQNDNYSDFDPNSWDGPELGADNSAPFEAIPHTTVVEWDKANNRARFKAIRNDNGEELIGCPVPTSDPSKLIFNEKDRLVKGQFDETYKLEII